MGVGSPWPSLWLQGELGRVGPYVAKFDHDLILGLLVWERACAIHVTLYGLERILGCLNMCQHEEYGLTMPCT